MAPHMSADGCGTWERLGTGHVVHTLALEICFLYLHFTSCFFAATGQSTSPEAREFVGMKEAEVRKIADAAVENWKTVSLSNCSDQSDIDQLKESCANESECSTNECQVPQRDIQSLSCVHFDNSEHLTGCSAAGDGASCDTIQANYDRGFVSFPDSARLGKIPGEVDFSICGQRKLDATFKALRPNSTNSYFFNFYFASVDGSMRTYPGRQAQNCKQAPSQKPYDPRKRPWYKGAISIVHELVILLDCGSSMNNRVDFTRYGTRFQYAQNLTLEVLETLSPGSSVNIITFNQSSNASAARNEFLTAGLKDDENFSNDSDFQDLVQFVNRSTAAAAAGAKSDVTSGLALALDKFNSSSGKAENPLKIILLLTDGDSDTSPAAMSVVSKQLKENNIKLFLYQIGSNESTPVTSLACNVSGHKEVIVVQGNELYQVRSYFSFLARCHAASNESRSENGTGTQLAYWQGVYHDRGTLGDVITVSYPAMSDDELIGVAAIDIQMGGFELRGSIATLLGPPANLKLFHYRPGLSDTLQCQGTPSPALACSGSGLGAVCSISSSDPLAADMTDNHQCCESCRGGSSLGGPSPDPGPRTSNGTTAPPEGKQASNKPKVIIVVVPVVVAGVVGLLIFTFLVHKALRRRRDDRWIKPPPRGQRRHTIAGDVDDHSASTASDDTMAKAS